MYLFSKRTKGYRFGGATSIGLGMQRRFSRKTRTGNITATVLWTSIGLICALTSCTSTKPNVVETLPKPIEVTTTTRVPLTYEQRAARVAVLGYHQFEENSTDPWILPSATFRAQMQALKDAGITVIPMDDLLAWRRGERAIPAKSAVITIDDGYETGYTNAWPILNEFNYPFTMYVYTQFVGAGPKSITWDQLREMSKAGVDIASHSRSHDFMTKPRHRSKKISYADWLIRELGGAKVTIEKEIGIPVTTFAFPYGKHNQQAQDEGMKDGYQALFTVKNEPVLFDSPSDKLGRYMIQSTLPLTFDRVMTAFDPKCTNAHPCDSSPIDLGVEGDPLVGGSIPSEPSANSVSTDAVSTNADVTSSSVVASDASASSTSSSNFSSPSSSSTTRATISSTTLLPSAGPAIPTVAAK
jgi:peptidoglycan/xylan/chitin deacetylase (PgdA/CDA1 family)